MRASVGILAAVVLLLPHASHASEISITIEEPLDLGFGPSGAFLEGDSFHGIFLDGVEVFSPEPFSDSFTGDVQFFTDSLLNLSVTQGPDGRFMSTYEYGPGTVSIFAQWPGPQGFVHGTFSGTLLSLTIELCEEHLSPEVGDCGDIFGDSLGTSMATFGPGTFEADFARALGIAQSTDGGSFFMFIDGVTGVPESPLRLAGAETGEGSVVLDGVHVPEPQVTSLLCTSILLAIGRLRRYRRRSNDLLT